MPGALYKSAAIVGAAEADEIGFLETPKTALQLHIEAIKNVSTQTGIPISKIEGVFSTGWSTELCEHLGITPKYIDTTAVGGCSFEMHVHHAMAAIHAGIIDIALVSHGENGHSARAVGGGGVNYGRGAGNASPSHEMTMAYGLGSAPSNYAHAMVRHMHRYGNSREDYAHIAKVTRDWATLNPRAAMYSKEKHPFGGPITVEQVEERRLITWPLTILHCCMVADHGGAVIVASPKVAASLNTKPVWLAGAGESMGHGNMVEMDDFTKTSARFSADAAYTMAGLGDETQSPMPMPLSLLSPSSSASASSPFVEDWKPSSAPATRPAGAAPAGVWFSGIRMR